MITPDFPPLHGGIQRLVDRLVHNWTRLDARVVTPAAPGAEEFDRSASVPVVRSAAPSRVDHRLSMFILNAAAVHEARRFRPNTVLSTHVIAAPAAAFLRWVHGTPFVQCLHGAELAHRQRLTRFALGKAWAGIAVSRHAENLALATGMSVAPRIEVIPPGVDPPLQTIRDSSVREPLIVTIARLERRYKGHDVLLRALKIVRERVPDVRWVVIGEGKLRAEYDQLVRAYGLEQNIRFVGALTDGERDEWLDRARVFAMPSRIPPGGGGEGFGIAYLEAASHGVPAVAGDVGGALDAVIAGETGLLVDPTDDAAVANALLDLLLDDQLADRLGRAAAERSRQFAWSSVARRVEDVLLESIGQR